MAAPAKRSESAVPVLEVRALEKRFGAVEVLQDLSLEMAPGEFLVLVGPSGCGKSTLLNCIAGLEEASGGTILIGGRDVTRVPPRERDIAMVFQSYALYPTMTVAENIAFGMKVRGVPKPGRLQKVKEVAALLQIEQLLDRKPAALSGGQRQRVAMGRALVREPVLFLFDEPLSNLDAKLRVELRGEIKRLHQRLGASIVYVTHDQIEAMTLGTRIVVLNKGTIQQIGTPAEIYERPDNLFVADFMGSPPMNLVPAKLRAVPEGLELVFDDGSILARVRGPQAIRRYVGRRIVFGVRPEGLSLASADAAGMSVSVQLVENAGADTFVTGMLAGNEVVARLPGRARLETGVMQRLAVDPESVCFFDATTEKRIF